MIRNSLPTESINRHSDHVPTSSQRRRHAQHQCPKALTPFSQSIQKRAVNSIDPRPTQQ
jgi:hypothetical protein